MFKALKADAFMNAAIHFHAFTNPEKLYMTKKNPGSQIYSHPPLTLSGSWATKKIKS